MDNDTSFKTSPSGFSKIAHYRIIRKLGQGGMSIVYEGLDERLKRPVALKLLHPFYKEAPEYRSRFFREALAVARLTHPNIIQIYDVSSATENEQLYIATELLVGETLRDFAKKLNLIEMPELSAMIIWHVGQALEHAHQRGIIHRDVKPENIMICKDGQIKLMDFGIASLESKESITESGTLIGSLAHLSPESIKGQKVTIASDIFSLSTVFYWMLTQKLPFSGESPHALLKAIVDASHQKVQTLSPFISDELANVVDKGMQKEVAARFKSAHEMCEAIEHALSKMGIDIDFKKMQMVLKDPSAGPKKFLAAITDQIKAQAEIYQREKKEKDAFSLSCRLDASSFIAKPDKPVPIFKRVVIYQALTTAFALTLLLGLNHFRPVRDLQEISNEGLFLPSQLNDVFESSSVPISAPEIEEEKALKKQDEPQKAVYLKPSAPEDQFQEFEIIIWPFADVLVDGNVVAKDKKSLKLRLLKGTHRLSFNHPYAATVEKIVTVKNISHPIELRISLEKSKPAFLVVQSNEDGDVAVDGSYKGTVKKSQKKPIVIPLPDKTHAKLKEIIVSRDKFEPYILDTEFVAGQIKQIKVQLKPLAKEGRL